MRILCSRLTVVVFIAFANVARGTFFQQDNYSPPDENYSFDEDSEKYEKFDGECKCDCPKPKMIKVQVPKTRVKYYPISELKDDEPTKSPEPFKPMIQTEIYKELGEVLDKLDNLSRKSHQESMKESLKYMKENAFEENMSGQISYEEKEEKEGDSESITRNEPESPYAADVKEGSHEISENEQTRSERYVDSRRKDPNSIADDDFDWMKRLYAASGLARLKPRRMTSTTTSTSTTTRPTPRPSSRSQLREFKRPPESISGVKKRKRVVRLERRFDF